MSEFGFVQGHDFSPSMLRVILQARAALRRELGETEDVAARAGVTSGEFHHAWRGWLRKAAPRLKLWGALGVVPGDFGVILLDDGTQGPASERASERTSATLTGGTENLILTDDGGQQ